MATKVRSAKTGESRQQLWSAAARAVPVFLGSDPSTPMGGISTTPEALPFGEAFIAHAGVGSVDFFVTTNRDTIVGKVKDIDEQHAALVSLSAADLSKWASSLSSTDAFSQCSVRVAIRPHAEVTTVVFTPALPGVEAIGSGSYPSGSSCDEDVESAKQARRRRVTKAVRRFLKDAK